MQTHAPRLGILLMLLAIALLSSMDAVVKWLVMDEVHALQILALRSLLIGTLMIVGHAVHGSLTELRPHRPAAHALRAAVGVTAPLCFFIGIASIPLSHAVLVFFSSMFFITLMSIVFLGERVGIHRWTSIVVGYIGVFVVIRPALAVEDDGALAGYLLVLLASLAYALLFVSGRHLSATESVSSLVFSFNAGVGVVSLLLLPWFWTSLGVEQLSLIALVALLALGGHLSITKAFSTAEASLIAPFEYTGLLWALLFDALVWHHLPGVTTGAGALIIVASGLYVMHRERLQEHKTP